MTIEHSAHLAHFDALYAGSDDPWNVRGAWYEQRKRALLLACLGKPRYRSVFEPGCGNGELSAALARRCARLLACDGAAAAIAAAARRLEDVRSEVPGCDVRIEQRRLPGEWPEGSRFDLIVISELAYYFDAGSIGRMVEAARRALEDDGELVMCHYLPGFGDRVTATHAVHRIADDMPGLVRTLHHEDGAFLLQAWAAGAAGPGRWSRGMIGVAIPAHNEECSLVPCLEAMLVAARHPALAGEPVRVCVVLDACVDGSLAVVQHYSAVFAAAGVVLDHHAVQARQVGVARAAGATHLLACGARWLAFTDADTRVAPRWLAAQLQLGADVVCGSVEVDDWSPHGGKAGLLREHYLRHYQDRDGHHHIHGANLGVSAAAYQAAGGFAAVSCHEDVLLVKALQAAGARFAWSAQPRVYTSARTDARARGGFGDTLLRMAAEAEQAAAGTS